MSGPEPMIWSDMLEGMEHETDELMGITRPRRISVSRSLLRGEPFHDLDSASALLAENVKGEILTRTCEVPMPSINIDPSTSDAVPAPPPSVARVFARKKPTRGEEVRWTDATVLLDLTSISALFHLPLEQAAAELGLCRTALKVDPTISHTRFFPKPDYLSRLSTMVGFRPRPTPPLLRRILRRILSWDIRVSGREPDYRATVRRIVGLTVFVELLTSLGLCVQNACRKCGLTRWPFRTSGARTRRERTPNLLEPNCPTPHSHAGSSPVVAVFVDAPAASHAPTQRTSATSNAPPLVDTGGFLFASAESYRPPAPAHTRIAPPYTWEGVGKSALPYTWGSPNIQDKCLPTPPATAAPGCGRVTTTPEQNQLWEPQGCTGEAGGSTLSTPRSFQADASSLMAARVVKEALEPLDASMMALEDFGSDLSFLCAELEAVCKPG